VKAETAYQVIQALPQSEVKRLYSMLGVLVSKPQRKRSKSTLITDEEAVEFLLTKLHKPR